MISGRPIIEDAEGEKAEQFKDDIECSEKLIACGALWRFRKEEQRL